MVNLIANEYLSESTSYIRKENLQNLLEQLFGGEIDFEIRVDPHFLGRTGFS